MASIAYKYYSKVLGQHVDAQIFLPSMTLTDARKTPDEIRLSNQRRFKTLVLLHGYSSSADAWMRFSQMELFGEDKNLAIICPAGGVGHYTDWKVGQQWLTYLQKEFLPAMRATFPLSDRREDTFVGGLSMGGYGACK